MEFMFSNLILKYINEIKLKSNIMINAIFGLIILPLLIVVARIADVSLQTLRIIFTSRDKIKIAPIVGFFEVLIWLLAIGQLFDNLTNILYYTAYASGFAIGNYVGIFIDRKLSIGLLNLQLIVIEKPDKLLNELKKAGYGLTVLTADGFHNILIQLIIRRKNLKEVLKIIETHYENAFITLQQVQSVKGGVFPPPIRKQRLNRLKQRKGK
ncbi:MAG: DUF2179 domain-containing protein [Promethearchaeota archaeon]|nr:MAG: DUF2179 domain-containing protein [Candidatus Lokiarchaeota archaeon]